MFFYIDRYLKEPFRNIEDVISKVVNPLDVREKIASRFGLKMPEFNEERVVGSQTSTPTNTTPTTPSTPIIEITDESLPEDTFTLTSRTTAM